MRPLPSNTITFLFTDIEGSTKLWEQSPDLMRAALARHDQILREIIESHGGFIFKMGGDAFCAAFADAPAAVHAAFDAQCAVQGEPWHPTTVIRIRIALHTGEAEERGGDYFGQTLNCVAKLLAVGHGGQILLSQETREPTGSALPPSLSFKDLGERRLKHLGRPVHVCQIVHPSLPFLFPPLRSLGNPDLPNNLPQQVTSFIGREKENHDVQLLLGKSRLLTLTGAGGAGKTRLSLEVVAGLLDRYFDGVWMIELASLSNPALVPQVVADEFGVQEEPGKPLVRTLAEFLKPKQILLILDNCEHLLMACASLSTELLKTCPQVCLLASSREPLGIAGEQIYHVPMLSLPDPKEHQTVDSVSQYEAAQLFVERAKRIHPAFAVTAANAPAVAQVCWRLDGIPLALELAAARVRSLSVEQITARLDDRFLLLTGGSRTALPRQQTLRALIDWSFALLRENEQALLQGLSVFAGGWTLDAAEKVGESEESLDLLASLVDKSLVIYEERTTGEGRYRLLETVRQYARDRLAETGNSEIVKERHAACFLELAEQAAPQLREPEGAWWLERLELEHDNLRASLSWYAQNAGTRAESVEAELRLVVALWRFWAVRGHYSEGRQWLERALETTQDWEPSALRAIALNGAGILAQAQHDYDVAQPLYEKGLTIYRHLGHEQGIANTLNNLGSMAEDHGDLPAAQSLLEEGLAIQRQLGNEKNIAMFLNNLGNVMEGQGDAVAARAFLEESLAISRSLGNQQGVANTLNNLANRFNSAGDYSKAQSLFFESLLLHRNLGEQMGIIYTLEGLGAAVHGQNQFIEATQLWAASYSLREIIGIHLKPAEQEVVDLRLAETREILGTDAFNVAWSTGRAMTLDEIVEYARPEKA